MKGEGSGGGEGIRHRRRESERESSLNLLFVVLVGKYNVQIRAFTADEDDLLCENLKVGA